MIGREIMVYGLGFTAALFTQIYKRTYQLG